MADTGASSHDTAAAHDHVPSGWKRWVFSTNHKDIGTMYLIFAVVMGVVGGVFSILMRMELAEPGSQILGGDHQLFNVLISGHGLIMVSSLGSYLSGAGALLFLFIVWRIFARGAPCPDNPWGEGATTLEWTVSSPPPFHTFEQLPRVE